MSNQKLAPTHLLISYGLFYGDRPELGWYPALSDTVEDLIADRIRVVVIEYNLGVIKTANWVIDLRPDGGVKAGDCC